MSNKTAKVQRKRGETCSKIWRINDKYHFKNDNKLWQQTEIIRSNLNVLHNTLYAVHIVQLKFHKLIKN